MKNVVDVEIVCGYYSGMAKTIRNQEQLRAHLESVRLKGETDQQLADRLDIHVNTLTKLKYGVSFQAPAGLRALGLTVLYQVDAK